MSSFPVDDHIPLPNDIGRRAKYPWKEMAVGHSFFVPGMPDSIRKGLPSAAGRANIKIATRTVSENGVTGIRVWRVA